MCVHKHIQHTHELGWFSLLFLHSQGKDEENHHLLSGQAHAVLTGLIEARIPTTPAISTHFREDSDHGRLSHARPLDPGKEKAVYFEMKGIYRVATLSILCSVGEK